MPPAASAQHVENHNPDAEDVTEIRLSPTPQDAMDTTGHESGAALHREMAETEHREPFVPGLQQQQRRNNSSDAAMEDVRGGVR
jgi:hypothetical protein